MSTHLRQQCLAFIFCVVVVQNIWAQSCPSLNSLKVILLNKASQADAYPHLSADGLRLYYTARRDSGFGRMYYAERISTDKAFTQCSLLSSYLKDGYFAGSLTADELTLYLCNGWQVYVSKRTSLNEAFSTPTEVTEIARGFAPAISPDGRELMLQGQGGGKASYFLYQKGVNGKFQAFSKLNTPSNYEVWPGQFSKDGLRFYVTTERKAGKNGESDSSYLLKFTRPSLSDSFSTYQIVRRESTSGGCLGQTTFNADETILIGVRTKSKWEDNDLTYLDWKDKEKTVLPVAKAGQIDTLKLEIIDYKFLDRGTKMVMVNFTLRLTNTTEKPIQLPVDEGWFFVDADNTKSCLDSISDVAPVRSNRCVFGRLQPIEKMTLQPGAFVNVHNAEAPVFVKPNSEYRVRLVCTPFGSNVYAKTEWILPEPPRAVSVHAL